MIQGFAVATGTERKLCVSMFMILYYFIGKISVIGDGYVIYLSYYFYYTFMMYL